jgi:predicted metal-binding membrane protein
VERRLYLGALVVFAVATTLTLSSTRMMGSVMTMPGGWSMAMAWTKMAGQSWIGAATMFAGMWLAMMLTMMLPSSLPMMLLYRRLVVFRGEWRPDALVWIMAGAYFLVWSVFGLIAYILGVTLAHTAMESSAVSRAIPLAAGAALIAAGVYQLTPWKLACLRHCRQPLDIVAQYARPGWRGAIRLGAYHGLFCTACCWALMLIQLVLGVMNLWVMAGVAAVIALEKLTTRGPDLAPIVGVGAIALGISYLTNITAPLMSMVHR